MSLNPSLLSPVIASIDKEEIVQRKTAITLRVRVTLIDGSTLYANENHILSNGWIDYSYHWQTANNELIHRWDNAHAVDLPTSPHHRGAGPSTHRFRREYFPLGTDDAGESPPVHPSATGYFKLKYSASGPSARAGKNDSAVMMMITAKVISPKVPVSVGNVPDDSGTYFF